MKKILILLTLITTSIFSASFDCDKASTKVEKLICSNDELSKLDEEMSKAYKETLVIYKNELIVQRAWLKERNACIYCNDGSCNTTSCLKDSYIRRLTFLQFYLQPNVFQVVYSQDNATCDKFVNLLNDDLKENNEVNLSKHKEFNWANWEQIQEKFQDNIFIDYFDINNDGIDEAVFKTEGQYHYFDLLDIKYTTKEDGKIIKEYIPYKIEGNGWTSKRGELYGKLLTKEKDEINNGFGVFTLIKTIIKQNTTVIIADGCMYFPEPYPMKLNNKYYISVFGNIKSLRKLRVIPMYTMPNNGNIVALVEYTPNNTRNEVCVLTRANPNTKKYFDDAKIGE